MSSETSADMPRITADGVDRTAAQTALERVLTSKAFAPSAQSCAFLRYVAMETLAGRADRLNERSVGRNALGRPELFDGRQDSLVRVQATRVRKALTSYYQGEGAADPLRVILPQGSYAVAFEYVDRLGGEDDPVVLVTISSTLDDPKASTARAAGAAIAHALSSFPGLSVIGPRQMDGDVLAEARAQRIDYVLAGTVGPDGDGARLLVHLMETRRGATLWSRQHDLTALAPSGPWPQSVAAEVGDYTGVVLRHEVALGSCASSSRSAKRAFFAFTQTHDLAELQRASDLVEAAVAEGAADSLLLSMSAGLRALAGAYALTDDVEQALEGAEWQGREALALDPTSALAHQALGVVALVRGDAPLVRHFAELAVQCSPHHPSTLASAAALLSSGSDWPAAADLMRHVVELTTQLWGPAWSIIAIERLLAHDDEAALAAASHIHASGFPWGPLYRALAYDGLGRHDRARQEMAVALSVEPRLVHDPADYLEALWAWDPEHLASLLQRFERYRDTETALGVPEPRDDASQRAANAGSRPEG